MLQSQKAPLNRKISDRSRPSTYTWRAMTPVGGWQNCESIIIGELWQLTSGAVGLEMRKLKIIGLEWYGWQLWAVLRHFAASTCTRPAMMPPATWRRTEVLPNLNNDGGAVWFCRAREAQAED